MKTRRGRHPKSLANLRPFQKGESGNPGGRPLGFVGCIREQCGDDYERIVEALCVVAFGTAAQRKAFFGERVRVTMRDRLAAIVELRDSGPGRPALMIEDTRPTAPAFALPVGCAGVDVHFREPEVTGWPHATPSASGGGSTEKSSPAKTNGRVGT